MAIRSGSAVACLAAGQNEVGKVRSAGGVQEETSVGAFQSANDGQLAREREVEVQRRQEPNLLLVVTIYLQTTTQ